MFPKVGIFLLASFGSVKAQSGTFFPIDRERLYEDYYDKISPNCVNTTEMNHIRFEECSNHNELTVDYACRYSDFSDECYCCGAFFHYIEQGKVCTKYCLKESAGKKPGQSRYCQPRLIVLPFNWGDSSPETITLDNGKRRRPGSEVKLPYDRTALAACPSDPHEADPVTIHSSTTRLPNTSRRATTRLPKTRRTTTTRPKVAKTTTRKATNKTIKPSRGKGPGQDSPGALQNQEKIV